MQKSVFSDEFAYGEVELVVECDGSYRECDGVGGIGWVITDYSSKVVIAEGRETVQAVESTTEAEFEALRRGLDEAKQVGGNSLVLLTDLDTVVERLENAEKNSWDTELYEELGDLNSWLVKSVDRDEISRAHDLADYSAHH